MAGAMADQLASAYGDVAQEIPSHKGDDGYVHVELLEQSVYEQHIMERIAQAIETLMRQGVPQRRIAILARKNSEIEETAKYFQTHVPGVNIVSDEAYRLDSSISVGILIAALRVLSNEKDILSKALLAKAWTNDVLGRQLGDDVIMLGTDTHDNSQAFKEWLPEGFGNSERRSHLRSLPLTDLVEALYNLFDLDRIEGQSPYICTFYDIIADHLNDNTSDIDRFLAAWDDRYHKETIHGEGVDGVRIVSIHKSKGLEFDNVILPFCNWKLEQYKNTIWCIPHEAPFDALPILPIDYSRGQMLHTAYEDDYLREHFQNTVDNLNLLYVAFTRAKTRLFVYGAVQAADDKKKKKSDEAVTPRTRSQLIEQSLKAITAPTSQHELRGCTMQQTPDGSLIFDYGDMGAEPLKSTAPAEESRNIFLQADQSVRFRIKSYPMTAQFRQSNNSRVFTTSDEGEILRAGYIERGNILHNIFSRLKTTDDIEKVLQELKQEGILYDEVSPQELQQMLTNALKTPKVRDWFSAHWHLHNECSIVYRLPSGKVKTLRPDRVMSDGQRTIVVDFKFGSPQKRHKNQVSRYMELLRQMGRSQVEGYLWYVDTNKTVKV